MPNFKDAAITKAQSVVNQVKSKAADTAKQQLQSATSKAKSMLTEGVGKSLVNLESKLKDGVSNVAAMLPSGDMASISSSLKDIASVVVGELATGAQSTIFAKPAFFGKAVEAIGVQDVYGLSSDAVVNLAALPDSLMSKQIGSAAKGLGGLGDALKALTSNGDGSFGLDAGGLKDRLKDALGGSAAALQRMGGNVLASALSSAGGATGALMSTFNSTIDNVSRAFSTTSVTDAKGLFNSINQLTKSSDLAQFFDVGAETKLLTGLFSEAIDLKIPKAVDVLLEHSQSDQAALQALKNVAGSAMLSGDVDMAGLMASQLGSNQLLALMPQAATALLANYNLAGPTKQADLGAQASSLLATLASIDPQWDTAERGSDTLSNLQAFSTMSADARRVLETVPDYATALLIAGDYPPESIRSTIGEMYPLSPMSGNFVSALA